MDQVHVIRHKGLVEGRSLRTFRCSNASIVGSMKAGTLTGTPLGTGSGSSAGTCRRCRAATFDARGRGRFGTDEMERAPKWGSRMDGLSSGIRLALHGAITGWPQVEALSKEASKRWSHHHGK